MEDGSNPDDAKGKSIGNDNDPNFHRQNLTIGNDIIDKLSPMIEAAAEMVEIDVVPVPADMESDIDAESNVGAEDTEVVSVSVSDPVKLKSLSNVETSFTRKLMTPDKDGLMKSSHVSQLRFYCST